MNLVDLIKGQIGGDSLSRLASSLGVGTDQARSAVDATVPSVLAGLTHVASTPDGARKLDGALSGLDDRLADNPAAVIGGGPAAIEGGTNLLSSLFGGGLLSGLTGALGKFTGMSGGAIGSLLAMVGPMILGVLKKQKSSFGFDAGGVANLLSQQKQNIASAMPAGLGTMLGNLPGIGSITGGATQAVGRATDAARSAVSAATPRTSIVPWAVGALAVLLVGLLLWKAMTGGESTAPVPAPVAVNPTPARLPDAIPAGAEIPAASVSDISTKVTDTLKTATDTLGTITDASSADAALPKLRDVSTQLGSISELADKLPASSKSQITALIKPMSDKLNPLIDKALAIPGVSDKIGPIVKEIRTKLTALSGSV